MGDPIQTASGSVPVAPALDTERLVSPEELDTAVANDPLIARLCEQRDTLKNDIDGFNKKLSSLRSLVREAERARDKLKDKSSHMGKRMMSRRHVIYRNLVNEKMARIRRKAMTPTPPPIV